VDLGRLQYSDKVVKHWPEFGQNGKENITVADVMRHEGGLYKLCTQLSNEETHA
jgi:CubicO group peptidase (beta-lactamase class C family)